VISLFSHHDYQNVAWLKRHKSRAILELVYIHSPVSEISQFTKLQANQHFSAVPNSMTTASSTWEWGDLRLMLVLLMLMTWNIIRGSIAYADFEVWDTTKRVDKVCMITAVVCASVLPLAVLHTIQVYIGFRKGPGGERGQSTDKGS
jgi:hypothetical protein